MKLSPAARVSAVVMGLVAGAALVNDLGSYHWFQPYDRAVYGVALLMGMIWYACFGDQAKAWIAAEQAKQDLEDGIK